MMFNYIILLTIGITILFTFDNVNAQNTNDHQFGHVILPLDIRYTSTNAQSSVYYGDTITAKYTIDNVNLHTVNDVFFGMSLVGDNEEEYSQRSQDKFMNVERGTSKYIRYFTIDSDVPSGKYKLYMAIWSDHPDNGGKRFDVSYETVNIVGSKPTHQLPYIRSAHTSASSVSNGDTITAKYYIGNKNSYTVDDIFLGMSFVSNGGKEYSQSNQDKFVDVRSGSETYRRSFTVADNVPAGQYTVHMAIWTNHPNRGGEKIEYRTETINVVAPQPTHQLPYIRSAHTSASSVSNGDTITAKYYIGNKNSYTVDDIFLGMSFVSNGGKEYSQSNQDKFVDVRSGSETYRRSFTVADNVPAGQYTVHMAIWTNHPNRGGEKIEYRTETINVVAPQDSPKQFDYSVSVDTNSISVDAGNTAKANVALRLLQGESKDISLSCSGMPSSEGRCIIDGSLYNKIVRVPGTIPIQIETGKSTTPKSYTIKVTGSYGYDTSNDKYDTFTVAVNQDTSSQFDYSVSVDTNSISVDAGNTAKANVALRLLQGESKDISLSCSGMPSSEGRCIIDGSLYNKIVRVPGTIPIQIETGKSATPKSYTIKVTGSYGYDTSNDKYDTFTVAVDTPQFSYSAPKLSDWSITTGSIKPGDRIYANYKIHNPNNYDINIGLGMSTRLIGSNGEVTQTSQDKTVTASSGNSKHERYVTLPNDSPSGTYQVILKLWKEKVGSGNVVDSTGWRSGPKIQNNNVDTSQPASGSVKTDQSVYYISRGSSILVQISGEIDNYQKGKGIKMKLTKPDGQYTETELFTRKGTFNMPIHIESTERYGKYTVNIEYKGQNIDTIYFETTPIKPKTIDVDIESVTINSDSFSQNDRLVLDVKVKNTGNADHKFYVDAILEKDGTEFSKIGGTSMNLDTKETDDVQFNWVVPSNTPPDSYQLVISVWDNSPDNDGTKIEYHTDSIVINQHKSANNKNLVNDDISCGYAYKIKSSNGYYYSFKCTGPESATSDPETSLSRSHYAITDSNFDLVSDFDVYHNLSMIINYAAKESSEYLSKRAMESRNLAFLGGGGIASKVIAETASNLAGHTTNLIITGGTSAPFSAAHFVSYAGDTALTATTNSDNRGWSASSFMLWDSSQLLFEAADISKSLGKNWQDKNNVVLDANDLYKIYFNAERGDIQRNIAVHTLGSGGDKAILKFIVGLGVDFCDGLVGIIPCDPFSIVEIPFKADNVTSYSVFLNQIERFEGYIDEKHEKFEQHTKSWHSLLIKNPQLIRNNIPDENISRLELSEKTQPTTEHIVKFDTPSWFQNNIEWWKSNIISDNEINSNIEYIIDENIAESINNNAEDGKKYVITYGCNTGLISTFDQDGVIVELGVRNTIDMVFKPNTDSILKSECS